MNKTMRTITMMQDWSRYYAGGIEIKFTGHNPAIIDGIPMPWHCSFGTESAKYSAYGTSMENAVERAHENWKTG